MSWTKTAYSNTLEYKEDVVQKLMKSLHEISKLLCAQGCKHRITNMEHQAVSDFPRGNHRQVFVFLDVDDNAEKKLELKKVSCFENGIDVSPFPLPQHEPTPTTSNNNNNSAARAPQPPPQ